MDGTFGGNGFGGDGGGDEIDGGCFGKIKRISFENDSYQLKVDFNGNALVCYNPEFKPLSKRDIYYRMNHKKRGRAIIINHKDFNSDLRQSKRHGTDEDVKRLNYTLKKLKFDVTVRDNRTFAEIKREIDECASADHSNSDCVLVIILSHGEKDVVYAKDQFYNPKQLWERFKTCKTLQGKPVLFIINACQGDKMDSGIYVNYKGDSDTTSLYDNNLNSTVDANPVYVSKEYWNNLDLKQADLLVAYSTVPGYYSWRNNSGTCYITALCEMLNKYGTELNLVEILTKTNNEVATNFESNNKEMNKKKQMPCFRHELTKMVHFGNP